MYAKYECFVMQMYACVFFLCSLIPTDFYGPLVESERG